VRAFPYQNEVYVGQDLTDATLLDNLLRSEGIDTIIAPPKAGSRIRRSVYVVDAAHMDRARAIVERYRRGAPLVDPKTIKSWRCRTCNELIEGQFDVCWHCGRPKAAM
jgi:hypothetical protein